MNPLTIICLVSCALSLANAQSATYTSSCPSGEYYGYDSTARSNSLSPVLTLAGKTYNSGGFYSVTDANGADQCCYNCATQTSGTCTTWTYDGCGKCYLSSATGSANYLYSKSATTYSTGCGMTSSCSSFVSGFVNPSTTTTTNTGVTTSTVTTQSSCFIATDVNVPTSPTAANADTYVSATSATDCCNQCGAKSGCLGFAYFAVSTTSGGCWLKYYDPFGTAAPTSAQNYPGMILGSLNTAGKK